MNSHDYRLNPNVNEQWITCDKCHTWMVPLDKFEIQDQDVDLVGGDLCTYGLWHFIAGFLVSIGWSSVADKRRCVKLEKLKTEVLSEYPNSQICPRCLEDRNKPAG